MISAALVDWPLSWELWQVFSTQAHQPYDRIRYINSAVRAICIARNFTFNRYKVDVTTISWTTDYVIPYQIETFAILDAQWAEVTILDFDKYHLSTDKTNIIWIWDDTLVTEMVWTFTILYRGFPPIITTLEDIIMIPEHFYDVLVVKAIAYWYSHIKQYDKMWAKNDEFNAMIKWLAIRNTDRTPKTSVRMWEDISWGWEV